ncbi:hypothetical protein QFC21_000742 [Naganishia friedmannii]|uniref:Uncharacterized protein n=1 Tax=Naganishia friedmannii TaxID=89922 RepID=A0ACC2W861_9TREE|nr:hypothetical protein QFC21_000742 [Naganishia friedmannii]
MSRSPSHSPPPKRSPKSTPFLCRIFTKAGAYHSIDLFQEAHTLPLSDEKTSTLSTLLASLYPSLPVALQAPGCKYSFRTIYFDPRATITHDDRDRDRDRERNRDNDARAVRPWKSRELGRIDGRDVIRGCGEIEGAKTLEDLRYTPGDYLCLSIHPPTSFPPQQQQQHDTASFQNQNQNQNQNAPHQTTSSMRINPRASFGSNSIPAPAGGESWIDARNTSRNQPRSGGNGGFGIRGRGAVAASNDQPTSSNGWNNSNNGNGTGNKSGKTEDNDDGRGAVARPVPRGERERGEGQGGGGGRRSASPMRTANSGW